MATGSPHLLQNVGVFLLNVPHLWQMTSPVWYGFVTTEAPQFRQVARRWCKPFMLPNLHSQLPIEYSTTSSCDISRKSLIGNTEVNTDCKPPSSRSLGSRSICKKRWYDFIWTSIKFGIWIEPWIFAKSSRSRSLTCW